MPRILRSAIVTRPARQLYDLVADVERYPRLFSWCSAASVRPVDAGCVLATMHVGFAGMSATFTTRNRLLAGRRIELALVDGPFRSLNGAWTFVALGDSGCRIDLELAFETGGGYLDGVLASGFQGLADRMVDDFVRAAIEGAAVSPGP